MSSKESLISFQLTKMPDRLPPLSRYNRQFKLEEWQCSVLAAIDDRQSAVVCAPTSSGKTLLSTYTCKNAKGTVLFVLPSEVLVWQVASTYYQFFKGNVTFCTNQITNCDTL
jgi:ATP-dependent RNA helicase DDX60